MIKLTHKMLIFYLVKRVKYNQIKHDTKNILVKCDLQHRLIIIYLQNTNIVNDMKISVHNQFLLYKLHRASKDLHQSVVRHELAAFLTR